MDELLESDYGPLLRFNSTKVHRKAKLLFSTVRPWVSGYHWKARGLVAYDYKGKRWDGIHINPTPVRDIKLLLPMTMSGENRMFQIAGNDETSQSIRILEIEPGLREDVLADGLYPISSACYTRAVYGDLKDGIVIENGVLQLSNVSGSVDWEVLWKSDWSQGCWTPWAAGTVCHSEVSATGVKDIQLGVFNGKDVDGVPIKSGKTFEFVIRWRGKADLRYHSIEVSEQTAKAPSIFDTKCSEDLICCDNNDPFIPWN